MTDLWHSLHRSEFSYLKAVAESWGLPFNAPDARQGVDQLAEVLLASDLLLGIKEILSKEELQALLWLDQQGGRAPWDQFTRQFGEIRQVGAGRLDREKPYLDPISPAEGLWYRALVARGFFDTETGFQEFAYLPQDIREIIMPLIDPERIFQDQPPFSCRVAAQREREFQELASTALLDHLPALLAGLRMGLDPRIHLPGVSDLELAFYSYLAQSAGLVDERGKVSPENIRQFFELDEGQALGKLWASWRESAAPGELGMVPDFQIDGELGFDHHQLRVRVNGYLKALGPGEWWSIESFIAQVKERDPDFLRSGGEYDSWFVRRPESDEFLAGFQHWDEVEGDLLRYFLSGPLHWLGLMDLGAPEEDSRPLAFRLSALFEDFSAGKIPSLQPAKPDRIQLRSQGEIRMTPAVPRKIRYQIARFCDWYPLKAEAYQFRISPASLARAEKQGLRVAHLLSLLENHAEAIPPNILAALQRWEKQGTQASIGSRLVMRVGSPAVLKALKRSKASRYILEQLGPTAVIIRPGSQDKVAQALIELGFFIMIEDQSGSQT